MEDVDRLELRRASAHEWLLHDRRYPPDHTAFLVARIHINDDDADDVGVVWLRETPLPTRYLSPLAVLEDFRIWESRRARSTRPVEIPRLPPPPTT